MQEVLGSCTFSLNQLIFSKSKGEFNGMLFAKFKSQQLRDWAVGVLGKAKLQHEGAKIWVTKDLPLMEIIERSVLFGMKNLVVEWGVPKSDVWVDADANTVSVEKEMALEAKVNDGVLVVRYGKEWQEYLKSEAWATIIEKAKSRLEILRNGKGTGKGKSKAKKE